MSVSVCFLLPVLRLKLPADLALLALVSEVLRIAVWMHAYSYQYQLKFDFFALVTVAGCLSVAAFEAVDVHADFLAIAQGL